MKNSCFLFVLNFVQSFAYLQRNKLLKISYKSCCAESFNPLNALIIILCCNQDDINKPPYSKTTECD